MPRHPDAVRKGSKKHAQESEGTGGQALGKEGAGCAAEAARTPDLNLVSLVEEKLRELVGLFSSYIEIFRETLEGGMEPGERSRACADLERLVRSADKLRSLLIQVRSERTPDVASTLLELMAQGTPAGPSSALTCGEPSGRRTAPSAAGDEASGEED